MRKASISLKSAAGFSIGTSIKKEPNHPSFVSHHEERRNLAVDHDNFMTRQNVHSTIQKFYIEKCLTYQVFSDQQNPVLCEP